MGRTIHQLLAAQAAGEVLSDQDLDRIERHHAEVWNAVAKLDAMFPARWGEWDSPDTGTEVLRQRIWSGLDAKDATELREVVRLLLATHQFFDDTVARWSGRDRQQRQRRREGGQQSGQSRREEAASIVRAVEAIKADNPTFSHRAAALLYLRDHDPAWQAGTEDERRRKLNSFLRLIRRAQKILSGADSN